MEGNEFTLERKVTVPRGLHMGLATVAPGILSKETSIHRRVMIHLDIGDILLISPTFLPRHRQPKSILHQNQS